jgi:hypothetical protein
MPELPEPGMSRISMDVVQGHRVFVWNQYLFDRVPWHVLFPDSLFPNEVLVAEDPHLQCVDFESSRIDNLEEWLRCDTERTAH